MAAIRHLKFLTVRKFTCWYGSGVSMRHHQIWCRSVKPLPRYGHFSIFQDDGRLPSWICYTPVLTTQEEYLVVFVIVQNLV